MRIGPNPGPDSVDSDGHSSFISLIVNRIVLLKPSFFLPFFVLLRERRERVRDNVNSARNCPVRQPFTRSPSHARAYRFCTLYLTGPSNSCFRLTVCVCESECVTRRCHQRWNFFFVSLYQARKAEHSRVRATTEFVVRFDVSTSIHCPLHSQGLRSPPITCDSGDAYVSPFFPLGR